MNQGGGAELFLIYISMQNNSDFIKVYNYSGVLYVKIGYDI